MSKIKQSHAKLESALYIKCFFYNKKKYKVLIRNIQKNQPRKMVAFLQISVALHRTASVGYREWANPTGYDALGTLLGNCLQLYIKYTGA